MAGRRRPGSWALQSCTVMVEGADDRRALVERVIASPTFARTAKLSAFLRFVCDRALDGATGEVSEQNIGVKVFGRPAAYSPSEDNIVRSQARLLRQRLDAYFDGDGRSEPVRISIPKGAYLPVFEPRAPEPREREPREAVPDQREAGPSIEAPENSSNSRTSGSSSNSSNSSAALDPVTEPRVITRRRAIAAAAALVLSAGGYGGYAAWRRPAASRSAALWRSIFEPTRNTLIVPADTGLVLAQDLSKQGVTLADYITGDYVAKLAAQGDIPSDTLRRIARRRYSGAVDVAIASRLMTRPEVTPARTMVRYARDLRLGELKASNAILLGAPHSNPWLQLFEKQLNFWLDLDLTQSEFVVRNRSPRPGEQAEYQTHLSDTRQAVWAVLSFLPNVDDTGCVLVLAGASTAGTEAAAEFLLNDAAMDAFLARSPAPNGKPIYFNVLLETNPVAGSAPQGRPVAWRFL